MIRKQKRKISPERAKKCCNKSQPMIGANFESFDKYFTTSVDDVVLEMKSCDVIKDITPMSKTPKDAKRRKVETADKRDPKKDSENFWKQNLPSSSSQPFTNYQNNFFGHYQCSSISETDIGKRDNKSASIFVKGPETENNRATDEVLTHSKIFPSYNETESHLMRALLMSEDNCNLDQVVWPLEDITTSDSLLSSGSNALSTINDDSPQVTNEYLDNVLVNILDELKDDDLDRLLGSSPSPSSRFNASCSQSASPAVSQTDSGFAAGSIRSLDDNEDLLSFDAQADFSQKQFVMSDNYMKSPIYNHNLPNETDQRLLSAPPPLVEMEKVQSSRETLMETVQTSRDTESDYDSLNCFNESSVQSEWLFCPIKGCGFWTKKPERMTRHKACHNDEVKQSFQCPDCGLRFFSLTKLLKHDRKSHTGVKDYECRLCNAEVTDIQLHMRTHRENKDFSCRYCTSKFRHRSSLIRHLFLHTGHRPYKCQMCRSYFTGRDRLRDHISRQHSEMVSDSANLEQLLDNSRNQEKYIEEKYRTNNTSTHSSQVETQFSPPAILPIQAPPQQQLLFQFNPFQYEFPIQMTNYQIGQTCPQSYQLVTTQPVSSVLINQFENQGNFQTSTESILDIAIREIIDVNQEKETKIESALSIEDSTNEKIKPTHVKNQKFETEDKALTNLILAQEIDILKSTLSSTSAHQYQNNEEPTCATNITQVEPRLDLNAISDLLKTVSNKPQKENNVITPIPLTILPQSMEIKTDKQSLCASPILMEKSFESFNNTEESLKTKEEIKPKNSGDLMDLLSSKVRSEEEKRSKESEITITTAINKTKESDKILLANVGEEGELHMNNLLHKSNEDIKQDELSNAKLSSNSPSSLFIQTKEGCNKDSSGKIIIHLGSKLEMGQKINNEEPLQNKTYGPVLNKKLKNKLKPVKLSQKPTSRKSKQKRQLNPFFLSTESKRKLQSDDLCNNIKSNQEQSQTKSNSTSCLNQSPERVNTTYNLVKSEKINFLKLRLVIPKIKLNPLFAKTTSDSMYSGLSESTSQDQNKTFQAFPKDVILSEEVSATSSKEFYQKSNKNSSIKNVLVSSSPASDKNQRPEKSIVDKNKKQDRQLAKIKIIKSSNCKSSLNPNTSLTKCTQSAKTSLHVENKSLLTLSKLESDQAETMAYPQKSTEVFSSNIRLVLSEVKESKTSQVVCLPPIEVKDEKSRQMIDQSPKEIKGSKANQGSDQSTMEVKDSVTNNLCHLSASKSENSQSNQVYELSVNEVKEGKTDQGSSDQLATDVKNVKTNQVGDKSTSEVNQRVKNFAMKLAQLRMNSSKSEIIKIGESFTCSDCGKTYKFENFLKVHRKRPCKTNQ